MDKLEKICGRGSVSTVSGQITFVLGVGSVEQIQAVNGTVGIARTNGKERKIPENYQQPRLYLDFCTLYDELPT